MTGRKLAAPGNVAAPGLDRVERLVRTCRRQQDESQSKRANGSLLTVIVAFVANLLIAIAKTVAASLTASASMVAEAAHSWADTGNEIFLLIAERRSDRSRTPGTRSATARRRTSGRCSPPSGCSPPARVVSIRHGIQQLQEPGASDRLPGSRTWCWAIAFVLEGISFTQAFGPDPTQCCGTASSCSVPSVRAEHLESRPLRAVFFEDAAALIGLLIAFVGIGAPPGRPGSPVPDAIGSILVGVLLAVIAVVLINRNRRFLVGEVVPPEFRQRVLVELLSSPGDRPGHLPAPGVRRPGAAVPGGRGRPGRRRPGAQPGRAVTRACERELEAARPHRGGRANPCNARRGVLITP